MRIERWWWLWIFCFVSVVCHGVAAFLSPRFPTEAPPLPPTEIEVALEPEQPLPPKPEPKKEEPKPKEEAKAKPVSEPKRAVPFTARAKPAPAPPREKPASVRMAKAVEPKAPAPEAVKPAPNVPEKQPGGVDPTKEEKPLPLGLPIGKKEIAPRVQITPADAA